VRALIIAGTLCLMIVLSEAQPIVGRASVIDGDTIEIAGQRIRLHGIDAPESRQLCSDAAGQRYRCGQRAALMLADWIDGAQPIRCVSRDRDRWGRVIAACTRGGADVVEWLVRKGHALDWPRYSGGKYADAQRAAKVRRMGVWQGRFVQPWDWRRQSNAQ